MIFNNVQTGIDRRFLEQQLRDLIWNERRDHISPETDRSCMHMHVQGHARNQIPPGGSETDLSEPVRHVSLRCRGPKISPLQGQRGSVALPMHSTGPCTAVRIQRPGEPHASSAGLWRLVTFDMVDTSHCVIPRLCWRGFAANH